MGYGHETVLGVRAFFPGMYKATLWTIRLLDWQGLGNKGFSHPLPLANLYTEI